MQTSGAMRREIADTHPVSSSGLTGRPSIPETSMIEPRSRGVLDHPPSRVTTVLYVATPSTSLRGAPCDDLSAEAQRAKAEAIHSFSTRRNGLLRGACHRARIRATRWLAMTEKTTSASPDDTSAPAPRSGAA